MWLWTHHTNPWTRFGVIAMRKFLLAALALTLSFGLTLAGEVMFVSYDKDKKELKVKEGDKEKVYKITDSTTFKNGDKEVKNKENATARLEKMKPKVKFELTADDKENVTEIKFPAPKKDK